MPTTDDRALIDHPLLSPAPTARLLQGSFAALFVVANAVLLLIAPQGVVPLTLVIAVILVGGATATAFSPAMRRADFQPWMTVVPFVDFAAIALIRLDQAGGPTNPMVMLLTLPALWLGVIGGFPPALALAVGATLVVSPDIALLLTTSGLDGTAQRTLMVVIIFPVAMAFAATVANALARSLRERQALLVAEQERRTAAARDIERSRRLLRETLDTLDVAVVIMSPTGDPVFVNRALREDPLILRVGKGDAWQGFLSVPVYDPDTGDRIPDDDTALARVARGERVHARLVTAGDPDHPQRSWAVSANQVYCDENEHLANVVALADITPLIDTLEIKKEFLAAVSHELRTPLTMLSGVIDIMRDDGLFPDEQSRGWIAVFERNIQRQRRLVDDLLLVASAGQHDLSIRVRPASLATIAHDACRAIAAEAERKNITVTVRGDDASGIFDPDRMAQVCDNLVTNAVRHSPAGGAVLVSTVTTGTTLAVSVDDTGPGMTDEELAHAFDPFFRSVASAEAAIPGTGLGLPIVQLVARAHGGHADLHCKPEGGLVATVTIPREPHYEAAS